MLQLKNKEEIEGIRKSCKLLAALFEKLDTFIKPGLSTKDIDNYCYNFIKSHGGKPACLNYNGFPASACVSVNNEVIHGIPNSKKIIVEGDLVKVDLDINLNGFISDSTHSYEIGKVSNAVHKLNVETRNSLYKGIEGASKSGARINDISSAIYNHVTKLGYGVIREYCGHGVGFAVHEDPYVPNYVTNEGNIRLKEGMVLAVEPMVTLGSPKCHVLKDKWTVVTDDKSYAAHWEHTIAITDNGVEILTEL